MKQLPIILFSLFLSSCSPPEKNGSSLDNAEIPGEKEPFEIEGLWALQEYVDSIPKNKTISRHRKSWPSWFAILIEIDKDSLRSYGSIHDLGTSYSLNNDTVFIFDETLSGQWILTCNPKSNQLQLKNSDSFRDSLDSRVYTFEKRPDLKHLVEDLDPIHKTSANFTDFFHEELFEGSYEVIGESNEVEFKKGGQIEGFQGFDRYEVDNYFGTLHPYDNLDNMTFYRGNSGIKHDFDWEKYYWEFHGDTLVLKRFSWMELTYQGRRVRDEIWELSNETIKMVKIKEH